MSGERDFASALAGALKVLGPYFDAPAFQVPLGQGAQAEIRFSGPIGKPEVDRLVQYISIARESFPDVAKHVLTKEELAWSIREAITPTHPDREGKGGER